MDGAEVLIPLTMFAGGFAMIFGIYYLKTRQNLAMIEKNMNPKEFANRPAPYKKPEMGLIAHWCRRWVVPCIFARYVCIDTKNAR